jgi:hypothetical protein
MYKAKIKLVCRQVIDEGSASSFEKAIFHASYQEFLLKSQAYNGNGKLKTFSKMKATDGRANSLHYKLGFSVVHFIAQLNNKMPLIKDNLGNKLSFVVADFELIESHTEDISQHKLAINYETTDLNLVEIFGEYMLLGTSDVSPGQLVETFILKMQPNLSIKTYQEKTIPQMELVTT